MKRSRSITISAAVALLGSVAVFLMGLSFLAFLVMPLPDAAKEPAAKPAIAFAGVMLLCLGLWGTASAVGLLRLREWARISTLIFGGLAALTGFVVALALVATPFPVPPGERIDPWMVRQTQTVMAVLYSFLFLLGCAWIYLFTRPAMKEQFRGRATPASSELRRRPVSITLIGCYLLIGGGLAPISAVFGMPAVVFGKTLTGASAMAFYLAYSLAEVLLGAGLLQLKPLSRILAIWFFVFSFVSGAVTAWLPGWQARFAELGKTFPVWMQHTPPPPLPPTWFLVIVAAVTMGVPTWFLVRNKAAFTAAGPPPANSSN